MGKTKKDVFIDKAVLKKIEDIVYTYLSLQLTRAGVEYDEISVRVDNPYAFENCFHTFTPNLHIYMRLKRGKSDKNIGSFVLVKLPGCCAYLTSRRTFLFPYFRNKGLGTALQEAKEEIAKLLNYSALTCTTTKKNIYENKILKKTGWKKIDKTKNKKTGNTVFMWRKKVD